MNDNQIDIVDRLRRKPPVWEEMIEAAEEIVRLRILVKKQNIQLHFYRNFNQKREDGKL